VSVLPYKQRSQSVTATDRVLQAGMPPGKNEGHTVVVLREIELPKNHNRLISQITLNGFIRRMTRMRRVMH